MCANLCARLVDLWWSEAEPGMEEAERREGGMLKEKGP